MNEPMTRISEAGPAAGVLAAAGLAEGRAEEVRMLTQDDLYYDGPGGVMPHAAHVRMPTQDDLPYDDGEPMESQRHLYQMMLLIETLKLHWAGRDDYFVGGNMAVYFSSAQVKHNDFRGPDFFLVLGVDGKRERKSWVVWDEDKSLDLVIEILSESTAAFDRAGKKQIYFDNLRVPEYFYYDPYNGEFAGFARGGGDQPIAPTLGPDQQEQLVSRVAGLALTRWQGEFLGITAPWLRWATLDGKLLPTKEEVAQQAQQRAEQEHALAQQATERAEQLAARLRELGVDPVTLD